MASLSNKLKHEIIVFKPWVQFGPVRPQFMDIGVASLLAMNLL